MLSKRQIRNIKRNAKKKLIIKRIQKLQQLHRINLKKEYLKKTKRISTT